MLALLQTALHRLRCERGFTLVEVLVATVTSVVVLGAAFETLIISVNQSSRTSDYVQATQSGRATMTDIVDELRSACFGPTSSTTFSPITKESNGTELIFEDAISKEAQIEPSEAQQHEIVWTKEAGRETGTLTDKMWSASGGEWPVFKFPAVTSTPTRTTIIAQHIAYSTSEGAKIPFFKYSKYAPEASESSASSVTALTALPEKLGEKEAKEASSVLISFRALPTNGNEKLSRGVDLSNQVTFAFSAPVAEPKIGDTPCT